MFLNSVVNYFLQKARDFMTLSYVLQEIKKSPKNYSDVMCQEVDKILKLVETAYLTDNTKVFYALSVLPFNSTCSSSLLEKHDRWFAKENMNYSGPLSTIHHYRRNYVACSTAPLLLFSSYPHLKSR